MRRRQFMALLGGVAISSPWPLGAQQKVRARIGVLIFSTPDRDPNTQSFLRGLRELGYAEGKNIDIEYRFAEGKAERLPELAAELVRRNPDLVFALGGDVAPLVSKATQSIPIVYAMSADPVKLGLAASLARPGGNATGTTFLSDELAAKRLEILKEVAPRISRVAFLSNPDHADNELPIARRAATTHGLELQSTEVRGAGDFDRAFESALRAGVDAVYVVSSRQTVANIPRIVEFAATNRLPLAGGWGAWAQAGGLVSYGPNVGEMVRQTGVYVDKILKGAKPSDLPIQQPTKFELLINQKTAKALDLTIPSMLLARADEVIE